MNVLHRIAATIDKGCYPLCTINSEILCEFRETSDGLIILKPKKISAITEINFIRVSIHNSKGTKWTTVLAKVEKISHDEYILKPQTVRFYKTGYFWGVNERKYELISGQWSEIK